MVLLVLVSFVSSNILVAKEYNVLIRNYSPNYRDKDLVFSKERKNNKKNPTRMQLKMNSNPAFLKL